MIIARDVNEFLKRKRKARGSNWCLVAGKAFYGILNKLSPKKIEKRSEIKLIVTSSTPIFRQASRKLSTFRRHRAIVSFGLKEDFQD